MLVLRVVAVLLGAVVVTGTLLSAARTVVVPRAENPIITRFFFRSVEFAFRWAAIRIKSEEARDRVLSRLAPASLLALPFVWAGFLILGASFVYWGFGLTPWTDALVFSGAAFTTFGFGNSDGFGYLLLGIAQGILGLEIIALMISFLPSIYSRFTSRETLVTRLEALAGNPCDPVTAIQRAHQIGLLPHMEETWREWSNWFADLEESHTTFQFLAFFRSPEPTRSWVSAAACVLDTAALRLSVVNQPADHWAPLAIRTGFLALRRVADSFDIDYQDNPSPSDPISISRAQFDTALGRLEEAGVPLVADRDQAWESFAGWRVNYDSVALALADRILAPPAPSIVG